MREIRNQIIIIHNESMKRFDQLYRMLCSNPHLGHQFHLELWLRYYIEIPLVFPLKKLFFLLSECNYNIKSYPQYDILQFILYPLYLITYISAVWVFMIFAVIYMIIQLIFFPWYYISGCIYPMDIELSIAYYRDIFDSNPDLNPPMIIDEMSDKLRSIVDNYRPLPPTASFDNYRPLPSTASFDYLRFMKETKTMKYTVTVSRGENQPSYEEERERVVTGSFIEFIKYA